jgi:DNA-binding NtrC family response regulator
MSAGSPSLVLVADDQPLIRWAIGRTLDALGFKPLFAGTRDEVRALLEEHAFAMAIVATPIEQEDSADLLRELRTTGVTRVIVLSESGAAVAADQQPSAIVVEKPFSLDTMVTAVQQLAAQAS